MWMVRVRGQGACETRNQDAGTQPPTWVLRLGPLQSSCASSDTCLQGYGLGWGRSGWPTRCADFRTRKCVHVRAPVFGDCGRDLSICRHELPSASTVRWGAGGLFCPRPREPPAALPESSLSSTCWGVRGVRLIPGWGNRTFLDALCHGKKGDVLRLLCSPQTLPLQQQRGACGERLSLSSRRPGGSFRSWSPW